MILCRARNSSLQRTTRTILQSTNSSLQRTTKTILQSTIENHRCTQSHPIARVATARIERQ